MPTKTYAFSGGVDAVAPYGQKSSVLFGGTWVEEESWTVAFTSTAGDFTLGLGYWQGVPTCCFTYKKRVYVGLGSRFVFSGNNDPTGFEEQNAGAGYIDYMSEVQGQDQIVAFSQLQGRLAVFAKKSIQLWSVDADPDNFALVQALENTGTDAPKSVQNVGDYDVFFLANSGVRSLRVKEVTLNAGIDDLGSPIDPIVQEKDRAAYPLSLAVVNPADRRYWFYLDGRVYVLSNHPSAKIQAWSTYAPSDTDGSDFVPEKFVIYNNVVFCRTSDRRLIVYGAADGQLYDGSIVLGRTPWLENKKPSTMKQMHSIGALYSGPWTVKGSTDQRTAKLEKLVFYGDANDPDVMKDSPIGSGVLAFQSKGTHYMFEFSSSSDCQKKQVFSAIHIKDQQGNIL